MRSLIRAADRRRARARSDPRLADPALRRWVSYDPPLEPATWPLWAAPIVLLARRRGDRAVALPEAAGLMGWVMLALIVATRRRCSWSRACRGVWPFVGAGAAARARRLCLAGPSEAWRAAQGAARAPKCPTIDFRPAPAICSAVRQCLGLEPNRRRPQRRGDTQGAARVSQARCAATRRTRDLWVAYGYALVVHGGNHDEPGGAARLPARRRDRARPSRPALLLRPRSGPGRQL